MATSATSLLGLALPVTGELSGTWGDTVNNSLTALLDTAVAGTTTLSSDADVTLTTTTLASNQARQAVILWTAGGTVTRNITAPAQSKTYIVINKTTSTQSIVLRGVGPTTGITIAAAESCVAAWNGVDFIKIASTTFTGTLPVANGGTGLTSGTSGGILAYTASGTLVSSAALAANALVIGGGAGVAPSTTTTGTGVLTFLGTPSSANLASAVTDETGSGSLVFGTSPTVNNPTVTNYVESVVAIGTVTTASTLALTNGTVQTATLTASTACTFTMPTATAGKSFVLLLKQAAATGNGTATFTGVKWNAGGAPTITAAAGKMDILTFVADGTNWYGSFTQGYTP